LERLLLADGYNTKSGIEQARGAAARRFGEHTIAASG
jgi:hypothetical protein